MLPSLIPSLDPATFLFSLFLFGLVMAAMSFSAARSVYSGDIGLQDWGRSCVCMASAFLMFAMRGTWPDLVSIFMGNSLIFGLLHFANRAFARLFNIRAATRLTAWAFSIAVPAMLAVQLGWAALSFGSLVVSLCVAIMLAHLIVTILVNTDWRHLPSTWLLLSTLSAAGCALLIRGMTLLFGDRASAALHAGSGLISWTLVAIAVAVLGTSLGFFLMVHERLRNDLVEHARRDGLTGLLNRPAFLTTSEAVTQARIQQGYALIMIDLDHFKQVNDTHGHLAGDKVIRHAAKCLLRAVRPNDIVGRFGGEEFCVLLQGCPLHEARQRSESLIAAIAADTIEVAPGVQVRVTASAGFAWRQQDLDDLVAPQKSLARLFDLADQALYDAKRAGRNRVMAMPLGAG